jgi:hypothetical protein
MTYERAVALDKKRYYGSFSHLDRKKFPKIKGEGRKYFVFN